MSSSLNDDIAFIAPRSIVKPDPPEPAAPSPALSAALCFLLSLAMHLPWICITPLAGTEAHRALPADVMVRTHWWLAPMLYGRPFMTKPPLHHWLIALSQTVFGHGNIFVWRLPSALGGAALCAALALFAARWFGRLPGLISGLLAVGMIAIWGQSQVADIDSTNTLATALTALCGIELFFGEPRRRWIWVLAAALAFAATLLTKGPAGLPLILGVWVWGIVSATRHRQARKLLSPGLWIPFIFGIVLFFIWGTAAKRGLALRGLPLDLAGAKEGARRLHPEHWTGYFFSLFVFIPELFLYGLPASAALPLSFDRAVRKNTTPAALRIMSALAGAVLVSWGICAATGMSNPRYAYPTLAALCPLAGGVAVAAARTRRSADWLRLLAIISALAFLGATVGLSIASWKMLALPETALITAAWEGPFFKPAMIVCIALALAAAVWTIHRTQRNWRGAWGLVLLAMLASVPFGIQRHLARSKDSACFITSAKLREIVGDRGVVACYAAATDKPETFYYANVRVLSFLNPADFVPKNLPRPMWVLLAGGEKKRWLAMPGVHLERVTFLCRNEPTDYYLAWYDGSAGLSNK